MNPRITTVLVVLAAAVLLGMCNSHSKKGKWSASTSHAGKRR